MREQANGGGRNAPVRFLLAGAGLIGRRHAAAIAGARGVALAAVVDPDPAAREVADRYGTDWWPTLDAALAAAGADAALLATPNQYHAEGALLTIGTGLPTLVEKPFVTSVAEGRGVVEAAEAADVPLAVGHHRRHNPIIAAAKAAIEAGRIGRPVAAHVTAWMMKPRDYFATAWRREPGGGPVAINLIHEIDVLRYLCGPVAEVAAMTSNAARGHAVEDTAVVSLRFVSGALGTLTVSDTAVAPWSWELTAGENPAYPTTGETNAMIAGTRGSIAVPGLAVWEQDEGEGWWNPIRASHAPRGGGDGHADPLVRQVEQFAAVARGEAEPLASGRDGLAAIAVIEAIHRSARDGRTATVESA